VEKRGCAVTRSEVKKLETILYKVETLQNKTRDFVAKHRLGMAKDELLRLLRDQERGRALP
jgi:hypothetical protein